MCGGKRHHRAQCLGMLRAAGALPGDNCPLLSPLPDDAVNPSCVTGELWLLLQRSLPCLSAEGGMAAWSRSTAPARCVTNQQLLRGRPDAVSFPVAFHCGKNLPGSPWDRGSSGTRCYFWLPSFRCWVGTVWKRLRSHRSVSSWDCLEKCPILCLAF